MRLSSAIATKKRSISTKKLSYLLLKHVIQFCFLGRIRISDSTQMNHSLNIMVHVKNSNDA